MKRALTLTLARQSRPVCALNESLVRHPLEATHCECCGRPIGIGERFVWSADGFDYCSTACADEDRLETARIAGE
jgi:hypothetical protein